MSEEIKYEYQDNEDYNLVQKFWYKDKLLYQNCGIDSEMVGEYNGYTIFQAIPPENENEEIKWREVLHATLGGNKPLTIKEMKEKINGFEILDKEVFSKLGEN